MRAFIGIDLSANIKKKIEELQKSFSDENNARIRFVKPENQHLTLKFLGEISDVKLERIKERLKSIKFKEFELELSKLGFFPDERYIKVVWIGLKPEKKVKELQIKVDESLRDMFEMDKRFKVHLTVGRVEAIKDREKFINDLNCKVIKGSFKVKNFKLVKSVLGSDGPKHETLEVFNEM